MSASYFTSTSADHAFLSLSRAPTDLDAHYPTLNATLDSAASSTRAVIFLVVSHEYLLLAVNLLCSIASWATASSPGVVIASTDSWLCASLRGLSPDHKAHCIEPSTPTLASSSFAAYDLKLRVAARAAARGLAVLCTDCATLLLSDPFAAISPAALDTSSDSAGVCSPCSVL